MLRGRRTAFEGWFFPEDAKQVYYRKIEDAQGNSKFRGATGYSYVVSVSTTLFTTAHRLNHQLPSTC